MKNKTNEIIYVDCCEGDYNDVYNRFYLKAENMDQVEKYIRSLFVDQKEIEDIGSDPNCLGVWDNNSEEPQLAYYIEYSMPLDKQEIAELESYKIEDWNKQFFYHKIIDLTEIEN